MFLEWPLLLFLLWESLVALSSRTFWDGLLFFHLAGEMGFGFGCGLPVDHTMDCGIEQMMVQIEYRVHFIIIPFMLMSRLSLLW